MITEYIFKGGVSDQESMKRLKKLMTIMDSMNDKENYSFKSIIEQREDLLTIFCQYYTRE